MHKPTRLENNINRNRIPSKWLQEHSDERVPQKDEGSPEEILCVYNSDDNGLEWNKYWRFK